MSDRWPAPLRALHWTTALLVVGQLLLALLNALFYEPRPVLAEWLVQTHISLGAVLFVLTMVRGATRLAAPSPHGRVTGGLGRAADTVHVALYLFLLALPVSGYVKLAALGFEIQLFGVLQLPSLPLDLTLAAIARGAHIALACGLMGLVGIHVAAALFHKRLDGRTVLPRMRPPIPSMGPRGRSSPR